MNRFSILKLLSRPFKRGILDYHKDIHPTKRYGVLKKKITLLMILVTIIPLLTMAGLNYYQYQANMKREVLTPIRLMMHKTVHSFDLLLEERLSTVRSIAASHSFEYLSNDTNMNRLYRIFKKEFGGFVDLGVIDSNGNQVAYAGPYDLLGKDYSEQSWFHEANVKGYYISDVFMGYRDFPHIAIAVQQFNEKGQAWFLRATLDAKIFDRIIAAMSVEAESDAFLINSTGTIQTHSKFYGNILDQVSLPIQTGSYGSLMREIEDPLGKGKMLIAISSLTTADYLLVVIKSQSVLLKSWYALQSEMLLLLIAGSVLIILAVIKISDFLVNQLKDADERREFAIRELEHNHKLSSIGRLAAGVAHEINNPMAIVDQKAGLLKDLIEIDTNVSEKKKFLQITDSIINSVDRCKTITHRLLGFARRMEVHFENLDVNHVLTEVLGFLEKEALYRKIIIDLQLSPTLPAIASDKGQLQQVLLNIVTNSFAAVPDGGTISITSQQVDSERISVAIKDNGCGMPAETLSHIFEPFFSTKKGSGTGLGLSITYGIVKKLGGDIKVDSEVDEGTTFTVFLKIHQQQTGVSNGEKSTAGG